MKVITANDNRSMWGNADSATALKGATAILSKWGCTYAIGCEILRVSHGIYSRAVTGKLETVKLDRDQLTRAALVVSIHGSLRRILTNPENLYGFMSMENHNGVFAGRTPLSIIAEGDFISLVTVHDHIDGLKGASW